MKKILIIMMAVYITSSCSTTLYYQVYEVQSDIKNDGYLVYSDENCDVIYNLWEKMGSAGFVFMNKTDKYIYIDLKKSFFIKNGLANDYYDNKTYTSTESIGHASHTSIMNSYSEYINKSISVSKGGYTHTPYLWTPTMVSASVSKGNGFNKSTTIGMSEVQAYSNSVTINPVDRICIPPKAAKIINGFYISDYIYTICDDDKFNKPKKESEKIIYIKEDSPLTFRNRIVYWIDEMEFCIENTFWVSSIKNYEEGSIIETTMQQDCVTKIWKVKERFKVGGPSMFYNRYYFAF